MAITFEEVAQTVISLVKENEQLRQEVARLKAYSEVSERVREPDIKPILNDKELK